MIRWELLGERLEDARKASRGCVLGTHVNADGDGLGSQIGLYHWLRSRGHEVWMINDGAVPDRYRFLRGAEKVLDFDPSRCGPLIRDAGLFIVLDNSSPDRLGRLLPAVKESQAYRICIDHHASADPFWQLNCVDTEAAASGQLVYQAIRALGGECTPEIAEALYVAFVTDTGHFRFPKSTPEVHRIVADLMENGRINPQRIYRALYEDVTPGLNQLIAMALADTHYEYAGRFAWARLTLAQLQACQGLEEDTGDLVNMLLSVEGVRAAALFKELPEGRTKVSLRSIGDVDVNALAARFGGGGHKNASGALIQGPFEDGVNRVVTEMEGALAPS